MGSTNITFNHLNYLFRFSILVKIADFYNIFNYNNLDHFHHNQELFIYKLIIISNSNKFSYNNKFINKTLDQIIIKNITKIITNLKKNKFFVKKNKVLTI